MLSVLRDRRFAALFASQVASLLGTGILTVAIALLAARIAGDDAGLVLSIALTIRIATYVVVSPIATALLAGRSSRAVLVGADAARIVIALSLVLVTEAWQLYLAILLLQSASAVFTPTFQAAIPEVLPDEADYTAAQSLSRLAYDLESLVSPLLAAALVLVLPPAWLFAITALGFAASLAAVLLSRLELRTTVTGEPFVARLARGVRLIGTIESTRFLALLDAVVAAVYATVLVNTVVIALRFEGGADEVVAPLAVALALFGLGSIVLALVLPAMLRRVSDRAVMTAGAVAVIVALGLVAAVEAGPGLDLVALGVLWFALGAASSAVSTPSARLIRRDVAPGDRPAVFAARFSTSHAWYAVAYPLAGVGGALWGVAAATGVLAALALAVLVGAAAGARRASTPVHG
ncbi:MFS transporter [Microcella humidisoli]|uniref:MFS transporter n=1 Tax=Microcella humidisoli TaxID=2963406 RepID=A0ABY5FYY5_9MICO|nr:MFS transporter [Microcella humidisoli]UTT63541.1 MFS transporter [Microcella humidisoli]